MTIHEASKLTGVSCDMIRYYEKIGLLSPRRTQNRYRSFTVDDLSRIVLIKSYSNLGINLRSMKAPDSTAQIAAVLERHLAELERSRAALDAKITMGREMLACFRELSDEKPYSILDAPERALYSWQEHQDTFYAACSEVLNHPCTFRYYYRILGEKDRPQEPFSETGLMFYSPNPALAPQMEFLPARQIYRTVFLTAQQQFIRLPDLAGHFAVIRQLGYQVVWDILIYHLQEFVRDSQLVRLVCVDIPIRRPEPDAEA